MNFISQMNASKKATRCFVVIVLTIITLSTYIGLKHWTRIHYHSASKVDKGWITGDLEQKVQNTHTVTVFRKTFSLSSVVAANLQASATAPFTVFINGKKINHNLAGLNNPVLEEVSSFLKIGDNVIDVEVMGANKQQIIARLSIEGNKSEFNLLTTDPSWLVTQTNNSIWSENQRGAYKWSKSRFVAKLGSPPYGDVFDGQRASATSPKDIVVTAGFQVECLREAREGEGSWVAMTVDDKGRLYISPEASRSGVSQFAKIIRISILKNTKQSIVCETLKIPVSGSMGLAWAFDSLYIGGQGPDGYGIYRVKMANDDIYQAKLIKSFEAKGAEEHGVHAIVLGPENKLYVSYGNAMSPPEAATESPYRNQGEHLLIPSVRDSTEFFNYTHMPYGSIFRMNSDGSQCEVVAAGLRNHYDIAFNENNELFTFDSDTEWDVGLPWYRPTRILHVISGADFGFRKESGVLPDNCPDTFGCVVNLGRGSPTGVKFGTKSQFPSKYNKALFAMDWANGRIFSVNLKENGATYTSKVKMASSSDLYHPNAGDEVEVFLQGKGLPVTDLEFGEDGAMYFITGGRNTKSALYRVTYIGGDEPVPTHSRTDAKFRQLRHEIEQFHGGADHNAIENVWPLLGSSDLALRYAARIALEAQPVALWRERALSEMDPKIALVALLALSRIDEMSYQRRLIQALAKFPMSTLDNNEKFTKIRAIEISLGKYGCSPGLVEDLRIDDLRSELGKNNFGFTRSLTQVLVFLRDNKSIDEMIDFLDSTDHQSDQIWYAQVLRTIENLSFEQRAKYFSWFAKAAKFTGGNNLQKYILQIREDALAHLSNAEKHDFEHILETPKDEISKPDWMTLRKINREWKVADILTGTRNGIADINNGEKIFYGAQCAACHHFKNHGNGNIGPDLTGIGARFSRQDLVESILEPDKVVSDQYKSALIITKAGSSMTGIINSDDGYAVKLMIDPTNKVSQTILKSEIVKLTYSATSMMPSGLLNKLTQEEVFDLLAFLEQ